MPPSVRPRIGRSGAISGTWETSNGDPTTVSEAIGRSRSSVRRGEHREDAAQAPADHVHRTTAGVLAGAADRLRHDLLDPVLHAEVAVLEADLAVLHQVGRPSGLHEVLDQRAAAAQVVADRRRRERRHQQHRVAGVTHVLLRAVVVQLAQRSVVDQRARHRTEIGQPAVQHLVGDVGGCGHDLPRLGDQIHAAKGTHGITVVEERAPASVSKPPPAGFETVAEQPPQPTSSGV